MAVTSPAPARRPRQRLFWSRLHFCIRLLGLTGALLACVCGVFAGVSRQLDPVYATTTLRGAAEATLDLAQKTVDNPKAAPTLVMLLGGVAAALLALIVELLAVVFFTATRRSAFGVNALIQGALAAVLLVGINVWSFFHYEHIDCTRDHIYTLPAEDRSNLAQLDPKSQTTVIVYEMHKTFGKFTEKPDRFDYAAERKVVEKVRELADQLREVGPQLKVEILDIEEDGYEERLAELTRDAPELRKSIESAPENSLFFFARGEDGHENIQRLSFNDFYLLDKLASQQDETGRRNLVLLAQGVQPFVRRLLSLGAPKPRIGIAVIHDVLTTTGEDELGLQGLRKALEEHGFEVRDILLKRWPTFGMPEAAAYTTDESALDEMEQEEQVLKSVVSALEQDQKEIRKVLDVWKKAVTDEKTREELTRRYASRLRGNKITVEIARDQVDDLEDELKYRDIALQRSRDQLAETAKRKSKLNVTALTEQRRMTDLRAKMDRLLADCDVLFVPRMTLRNTASRGANIPASLYRMEKEQVDAIKDFLKAGKPLLACLGPTNSEPEARTPDADQPEPMELMLRELGIKLGKQTVLFDVEQKAFAERRAGKQFAGNTVRIPSVSFDWKAGQGHPLGYPVLSRRENPIRHSLRLASRGLGKGQSLDIVLRLPRPVYYEPSPNVKPDFDPDFLMSDADSWNEDQPFPTAESIPQFTRPKTAGEAAKPAGVDPLEERRRGPFPIGVAVQEELPKSWYGSEAEKPATARLAVIGQGGFFTGKNLPPAQEKMFVNTINWLLGRDDQLAREDKVWSYPRVNETIPPDSQTEYLWLWGVRLGLPALFLYLGLVVLLFRRLR
jgi:hypothetical protein